jgi:hypothetical protein
MRQKPFYLTKSRFKSALECPTKLYYTSNDQYANLKSDDEFLMALAEGGFQVGELAKYYHPGGYDITTLEYHKSLEETNELLQQENVIIYEPAIQFENFFIRVDVLVKTANKVDLIEVKAKSFKSADKFYSDKGFIDTSWKPYLYDIAFQNWVTQQAFPDWEITPYLMLADRNNKTTVDGLNQMFIVVKDEQGRKSVKVKTGLSKELLGDEILAKVNVSKPVQMIWDGHDIDPKNKTIEDQKNFFERAKEYSKFYVDDVQYPVTLGTKCKHCEFKNDNYPELRSGFQECWRSIFPDFDAGNPHVFDIWNFRGSQAIINNGVYSFDDIYSDGNLANMLNDRQYMQVEKTVKRSNQEFINPKLFDEMDRWEFPLHFIDFETSMVAVPFHKGQHPYEQVAFQFSCHTLRKNGQMDHEQWIETERGKFPNYNFVKALKNVLEKDNGTIFRYAAHENTVLRQIQKQMVEKNEEQFGEWIEWVDTLTQWYDKDTKEKFEGERNMVDMLALVKKYYYHPEMEGSNSIKSVLPAIFTTSDHIKNRYSKPVGYGINLKDQILWKLNDNTGEPIDPYKLLPDLYEDLDVTKKELFLDDGKIQEGSAALIAFGKMQFTEMQEQERLALTASLLQYCELDTLAMVMIYEHWNSLK